MYRRIILIIIVIIYKKNLESAPVPSGKQNSDGIILPDKVKTIHATSDDYTPTNAVYNLCNLIIVNNNSTNSTVFVGNGIKATSINTQKLRHDLFQAVLPYTGTPIFLVRVKVTENDTNKELVRFDVYPTINGSVISTDVISRAVFKFCNPTTASTYKALGSHLTRTTVSKTKLEETSPQNIPAYTIGFAVGIPLFLLLLLLLLLVLSKRKFSHRNKIMTDNRDGDG